MIGRIVEVADDQRHLHVYQFTDKQYERIISFQGKVQLPPPETPDQFDLF